MFNIDFKLLANQLFVVPEVKGVHEKVILILNEDDTEDFRDMLYALISRCDQIIWGKRDRDEKNVVNFSLAYFFKGYTSHICAKKSNDKKSPWYGGAILCYEKAIELSESKMAMVNCAALYADGLGTDDNKPDYKKAIDLYQRAATPRSFYNMGFLYENGRVTPDAKPDLIKAAYFFRKAFIGDDEDQKLKSLCMKKFSNLEKTLVLPMAIPILYHAAITIADNYLIVRCFNAGPLVVINLIKDDDLLSEDEKVYKFHNLIYKVNFSKEHAYHIAALCFENVYKHYTSLEEKARSSFLSNFYKVSNYVIAFDVCKKIISIDNDLFMMWINVKIMLIDFSDECAIKIIQLIDVFELKNKSIFKEVKEILHLIKTKDNQGLLKLMDSLSVDVWKNLPINILKRAKSIYLQNKDAMIPIAFVAAALQAYEKSGGRLDQKDEKGERPNANAWITKEECVNLLKIVLKLNIDSYTELADIFYQEHFSLIPKNSTSSVLKTIG